MVKVMGIINVDDDSFYSASRALTEKEILSRLETMVGEGADIIDFGACSTRPGSTPIDAQTEWERIDKALDLYTRNFSGIPFSVDTFRSSVVRRVYDKYGTFMVNDISAGEDDPMMLPTVGELSLPYIAMHKRGTPSTMQPMSVRQSGRRSPAVLQGLRQKGRGGRNQRVDSRSRIRICQDNGTKL